MILSFIFPDWDILLVSYISLTKGLIRIILLYYTEYQQQYQVEPLSALWFNTMDFDTILLFLPLLLLLSVLLLCENLEFRVSLIHFNYRTI